MSTVIGTFFFGTDYISISIVGIIDIIWVVANDVSSIKIYIIVGINPASRSF